MEMNLETIQDIRFFRNNWKTIYRNNKALDNITNAKVVISAKLLSDFFIEEERFKDEILTELGLLKYNFVEEWIEENIEFIEDKSEEEIRKGCLKTVKEELANLKSEKDLNSVNLTKYKFLYMIHDCYKLEPEAIIEKIEKDLAEIETVPVNAVEEVELEAK